MPTWLECKASDGDLGQPPFSGVPAQDIAEPVFVAAARRARPARMAGELPVPPAGGTRVIDMPPEIITEPRPADYADVARQILRGRSRNIGVVLSVVRMLPADGHPMIDTRTMRGPFRPRLISPPAHVVQPADVFEITRQGTTFRYIWILSNARSVYPVGGILFLPAGEGVMFHLVTFNVGALDGRRCTNVHHAEMQAVRWIDEQPASCRARLGGIWIWNLSRRAGLGYSPCSACCPDLARFLVALRALRPAHAPAIQAGITWLTIYDRNRACGHPTDTANLRRLAASGWQLSGPGWPPGQQQPPHTSPAGVRMISNFEGFCANLYDDGSPGCRRGQGNCTIGYGHLVHTGPCDGRASEQQFLAGISRQQGSQLLAGELARSENQVRRMVTAALTQQQFDALVSFDFNTGRLNALAQSLNTGQFANVPALMNQFVHAHIGGQVVVMPGLVRRRAAEGRLFTTGQYPP